MNKCPASHKGICRNAIGFGTKCNGYSEKCALKPLYDNLQNMADKLEKSMRSAFGIHGDRE